MQLLRKTLFDLGVDCGITPPATALLVWLMLLVNFRDWSLTCSIVGISEYLSLGPRRLRDLLWELEGHSVVSWTPGVGTQGRLYVRAYGQLAAAGRRGSGSYAALSAGVLDEFCCRLRPRFDDRVCLVLLVVATHPHTYVVTDLGTGRPVTSLTQLAGALRVNRRRAAVFEETLGQSLEWDVAGLRFVDYPDAVVRGVGPSRHRPVPDSHRA